MVLYKNVDIKDLNSIIDKGILSLTESDNNNWDDGKRADNPCDVVYLFSPLTKVNSFCNYGVALLEVEIDDALVRENELTENDRNKGKYREYITDKVDAACIKAIYIPRVFKDYITVPDQIELISWCEIGAMYYEDESSHEKTECPQEVLEQFAKTAELSDASEFNFFRGFTEERRIIDLYDIQYIW